MSFRTSDLQIVNSQPDKYLITDNDGNVIFTDNITKQKIVFEKSWNELSISSDGSLRIFKTKRPFYYKIIRPEDPLIGTSVVKFVRFFYKENESSDWSEIYYRGVATLRLNGVLSILEEFEKYPEIQVKEFYHLTQDKKECPNIILMKGADGKNYFFNADIISFVLRYIDADDIVVSMYVSDFFVCKFYFGGDLMAVVAGYRIPNMADIDIDELKKSIEAGRSMFNSIEEIKI